MSDPRIPVVAEAILNKRAETRGRATSEDMAKAALAALDRFLAPPRRPRPITADMNHVVEAIRAGGA
ncbi:hypothetical protein V5F77_04190 [Xanthobacter sp. DSM 24535]|uniref:hypothetical protein n=1 Tax=Roseixanthobacter psychrophilus TaxID=3119917 RepID=UPI00372AE99A